MLVIEERGQPGVEAGEHCGFLDVDALGMCGAAGVVLTELAAVPGAVVVPLALHSSAADPTAEQAREEVAPAFGHFAGSAGLVGGEEILGPFELFSRDQRLVGGCARPDPLGAVVPVASWSGVPGRRLRRRGGPRPCVACSRPRSRCSGGWRGWPEWPGDRRFTGARLRFVSCWRRALSSIARPATSAMPTI